MKRKFFCEHYNLGNRLKKNGQAVNNVYDNNNRIVEDDKYTYTHDDSGNLVKKVNKQSGYTHKYVWDYENKLQFVTEHLTENSGTLKTHTYIYDVLGRRIMKDSNGVVRKYVYDNEDILLEFDNNDSLQAKFTHGPGIDEPVEMLKGSQKYFYHTDGLGSITALTDGSGNTVQSYSYNAFGETKVFNGSGAEINPSSMIQSPYGYTGREWDLETSQYYYRARFYDPRMGRFIAVDPIGFNGGDANVYRYVKNNSTFSTDPSGKIPAVIVVGIVGGVVGGITGYQGSDAKCWVGKFIDAGLGAATGFAGGVFAAFGAGFGTVPFAWGAVAAEGTTFLGGIGSAIGGIGIGAGISSLEQFAILSGSNYCPKVCKVAK
ncbi:RHS repeat-associated core domain-containing protein [Bacteriovorax sp. PP10]|uniref:RHS repeat-associated core domain-containing protein n=1 Tax=Bacteriovorax antarcticus TaxID=3088717 RepID=A0ABU5W478_9BACT|nr:RHS repeat-associated core domain-containing protein [Bacteriovorax sp. PP10]MEA9358605.1 RHS repeat-associated core domain-containing protein [Bacteriovorax sp. PP10]